MNNILGQSFNYLEVIEKTHEKDKSGRYLYLCRCICGNYIETSSDKLKYGYISSCGCKRNGRKIILEEGEKFNRLTIIGESPERRYGARQYVCKCDCGNEYTAPATYIASGRVKSCGCLRDEKFVNNQNYKYNDLPGIEEQFRHHKGTSPARSSKIYKTWNGIKNRCYNPNCKDYDNYGGRGIRLCDSWMESFEEFYKWGMENGYKVELTVDRIDVNGNYEPLNCRWASIKEQANNTRKNVMITYDNKTLTLKQWSDELGIPYGSIKSRYGKYGNDPSMLFSSVKQYDYTPQEALVLYEGKSLSLEQWSVITNISFRTLRERYQRHGNNPDKLFTPIVRSIIINYNGKNQSLKQWANELGCQCKTLKNRLVKYGDDLDKVFAYNKTERNK